MAATYLGSVGSFTTTTSGSAIPATSYTSGVNVGDTLIAIVSAGATVVGTTSSSTYVDAAGNVWVRDSSNTASGGRCVTILRCNVTNALTTSNQFQFTLSAASTYRSCAIYRFSGVLAVGPEQRNDTTSGASSSSTTAVAVTPSFANEVVISAVSTGGGATSIVISATTPAWTSTSYPGYGGFAYQIQTTPTATSATWSWSGTSGWASSSLTYTAGTTDDAGSGTDTASAPTGNTSDTGSGIDAVAVPTGKTSDAGSFLPETQTNLVAISVSDASTSLGVDQATSSMSIPASDVGSSSEQASVLIGFNTSETGSGTESTPSTSFALQASDVGQAADVVAVDLPRFASDTGNGIDTATADKSFTANNNGHTTDSSRPVVQRFATPGDSGFGLESISVAFFVDLIADDSGLGRESATIIATLSASDVVNGVDTQDAHVPQPYFEPPTVRDIPNYLPDTRGLAPWLWRHYRLRERGVNVYLLSDGTYVQDTATDGHSATNIPLPWILNDSANEYATTYNWNGTVDHTYLKPHVVKMYQGGHKHQLTANEASDLIAAGYIVEYI